MARMIPARDPSSITNRGEQELYIQLRDQLPASWTVRHSYAFCWFEGRYLRDAEADFVIIAPERGVLVLEAKGSEGYECRDGDWFRVNGDGTTELTRNPFEQATTAKHKLVERIAHDVFGRTKRDFPGLFGHLVAYPFAKVRSPLPTSVEPCVMMTFEDMPHLKDRLEDAFSLWGNKSIADQFSPDNMKKVVEFFSDPTALVPVLAAKADRDERHIRNLTRMQFLAFRGLLGNQRVHVQGPAGSGKTLLAYWAAEAFAAEGKRVLFLCYNRVLAAWLDREYSGEGSLAVRTFFSVCQDTIHRAGLPFNPPQTATDADDFWDRVAPASFCEALDQLTELAFPRYDAVVVDEAQDFHKDWWLPIQLLLLDADNGRLCIFSDPEQTGIYGQKQDFPEPLVPYQLRENCRNTRRIAAYCGQVLGVKVEYFPECPLGVTPVILEAAPDPKVRAEIVRREIVRLMGEKFTSASIAVLSPWTRGSAQSCLSHVAVVNNKPLDGGEKLVDAWRKGHVIWSSTIKAFKGLEADCVILADAPEPELLGFKISDLYVAASRAKHQLIMAPASAASAGRLLSWAKSVALLKPDPSYRE